jgi:nitrogen fixation/metabolism regulation signal transduction histidine kinase
MLTAWQKSKLPSTWLWFVAFAISIALIFFLGLKPEYLFNYWLYVVGYNSIIIIFALFYLGRFLLLIHKQKKQGVVGVKFTFRLLRVIPILTLLPIVSFYAFSFSTVQENTRLAEVGFQNLNDKIVSEIDNVNQDLNLFRVQKYLDLSSNILRIASNIAKSSENYLVDLNNMLNSLVRNNQICRALVITANGGEVLSNGKSVCADFDIKEELSSQYTIVDKSQQIFLVKLKLKDVIPQTDDNDNITLISYFVKNKELNQVFSRISLFKTGIQNAKINISNTILTKQFLVDFSTTIVLTILSMLIIVAKMLENLMTPLNNLTLTSRKISRGEYGARASKTTGDDDMNILLSEFNQMSKQIKQARTGLDTKNIYLETIIQYSSGIIAFDNKLHINLINKRAQDLLGIGGDVIGKSYHNLTIDFLTQIVDKFEDQEQFSQVIDFNNLLLEITAATLIDNEKKLGFILIIKDITEITQTQKLLAWREVARRMAHEVKNPLNPIMMSAERLRHKFLASDETQVIDKTTKTIINQVKSIDNIISSFANLEQVAVDYKLQYLNKIIKEVKNLYDKEQIQLDLAEIPQLKLDKESISRVLINLIKNSLEAQANKIIITTKLVDNSVLLIIADDGKGFDKNIINQIFEPYITNKKSGTGLGMSIVAKIIKDHNGIIRIDKDYTNGAKIIIDFKTI